MKNNIFILCSIAVAGILIISVYFSMTTNETYKTHTTASNNHADSSIKEDTTIHTSTTNHKPQSHTEFPPPNPTVSQVDGNNIWTAENNDYQTAPTQYTHLSQEPVDKAFIKIGRSEIEALETGKMFNIFIPQTGNLYEAEVSTTQYHPNGDKTVKAFIQSNDGESHSVTLTQGQQSTFGTLSTPSGVYVLEADSIDGWIASKDDLVKLQDRSVTDEVHIKPDNSDLPPS